MKLFQPTFLLILFCSVTVVSPRFAFTDDEAARGRGSINRFCSDCHGADGAEAGVNFDSLLSKQSFVSEFRRWQNVAVQLERKQMPPPEAEQPTPAQRTQLTKWIRHQIKSAAQEHEGDPGHVVIRRLTSAEYGYAIQDLTGIDVDVERGFVSDAVGGAGFTNTGIVGFDARTLPRISEADCRSRGCRNRSAHLLSQSGTDRVRAFRDRSNPEHLPRTRLQSSGGRRWRSVRPRKIPGRISDGMAISIPRKVRKTRCHPGRSRERRRR